MAWHQSGQHTKVIVLCVPWNLGIFKIWVVEAAAVLREEWFLNQAQHIQLKTPFSLSHDLVGRGRKHIDIMKMCREAFLKKKEMPRRQLWEQDIDEDLTVLKMRCVNVLLFLWCFKNTVFNLLSGPYLKSFCFLSDLCQIIFKKPIWQMYEATYKKDP